MSSVATSATGGGRNEIVKNARAGKRRRPGDGRTDGPVGESWILEPPGHHRPAKDGGSNWRKKSRPRLVSPAAGGLCVQASFPLSARKQANGSPINLRRQSRRCCPQAPLSGRNADHQRAEQHQPPVADPPEFHEPARPKRAGRGRRYHLPLTSRINSNKANRRETLCPTIRQARHDDRSRPCRPREAATPE